VQEIQELLVKLINVRLLIFENESGEPKILFNYKMIPYEAPRLH
jgi:hypothetical protein